MIVEIHGISFQQSLQEMHPEHIPKIVNTLQLLAFFDKKLHLSWSKKFYLRYLIGSSLFHDGGLYHIGTSQWTGFFMKETSFMKELNKRL